MCEPVTMSIAAGVAITGAVVGGVGALERGKAEEQMAKNRAQEASWQSEAALRQGQSIMGQVRSEGAAVNATALGQIAGSNIDTTTGSAADLLKGNAMVTELDAQTAKANSVRQAWGLQSEARDHVAQGKLARYSSKISAVGAFLG